MIALGSDQAGYELKQEIIKYLEEKEIPYKDYGSFNADPVDYPIYGKAVGRAVADGTCEKGICRQRESENAETQERLCCPVPKTVRLNMSRVQGRLILRSG